MIAERGPSGIAPFPPPPDRLVAVDLPLSTLPSRKPLHRVHRTGLGPIFFGPGSGQAPTYRFDSATGAFGVFYVALSFAGALVETLLRNPRRRMVDEAEIGLRSLSILHSRRDLRLVTLHGAGLQVLGLDNSISTGPYEPCGAWADALFAHPAAPDGIGFRSRHDPECMLLAIFERPGLVFEVESSTPLLNRQGDVARVLGSYGKSIAPTS